MKVKGWKKLYHANIYQRKPGVATLISDKVHFRAKKNYQTQAGTLYIDSRVNPPRRHILNVYTPDNRVAKHVRQKLIELKGEIHKSIIIVGDFNTPLSTTRQKISKNTEELNTIN